MTQNKIIIGIAVLILAVVLIYGTDRVFAQNLGGHNKLAEALAQRLGVDQSRVEQALNDIKQENQKQKEANFEQMLDQAVKDGKITDTQKTLIINKRTELNNQKQNQDWTNMSVADRKNLMQSRKQDLEDWVKLNGIDMKYLFPGKSRMGMMRGMGR